MFVGTDEILANYYGASPPKLTDDQLGRLEEAADRFQTEVEEILVEEGLWVSDPHEAGYRIVTPDGRVVLDENLRGRAHRQEYRPFGRSVYEETWIILRRDITWPRGWWVKTDYPLEY